MTDYRPELLVPAASVQEAKKYLEAGADAVCVGEDGFAMRMGGEVKRYELSELAAFAHQRGRKVYVAVNRIMENHMLPMLPSYLEAVHEAKADAVVFGDPAVYAAAVEYAPGIKLHWNAEMTATNYRTANYWAGKGAVRAVLARELNLDEILEIKQQVPMEVQVQVHGMTNIYHSKRELLQSYQAFLGKRRGGLHGGQEQGMYLTEAERPGLRYPIFEDASGTHIMSPDDICMIEDLQELLDGRIDSFKIESLLKPIDYNLTVIAMYRQTIDAYLADPMGYGFQEERLEAIRALQDRHRELTFGFFYKEQVY